MMRLVIHPLVYTDVSEIMQFYESAGPPELAEEFSQELRRYMFAAAENPDLFSIRARGLRRVNLDRFPYHFLFRRFEDFVLILVVRHDRRHPSFGIRRV